MTILDRILAGKREAVKARKTAALVADLAARAHDTPPARGFARRLESADSVAVIAEFKRASPSMGIIAADADPARVAEEYERGGATCLSVLTDAVHFKGSVDDLVLARRACGLPVLRKDFVVDEIDVLESRTIGADCCLLIVAALSDMQLQDYLGTACECGLDGIVEVHDASELQRALVAKPRLVGINNRDLKTFETSLCVTEELAPLAKGTFVISESGITKPEDVSRVAEAGARGILVGESLMRQTDRAAAIRSLLAQ